MVTTTADPFVAPQEQWSIKARNTYLVVYQYALGTRLYLFNDANAAAIELLNSIHNHYTNEASVRVAALIKMFPQRYESYLFYDTAEQGSPPFIEGMPNVVLTGLR